MMLETIAQIMVDENVAIRLCPPADEDSVFAVAAFTFGSGVRAADGYGETLEEAMRDMLVDLGVLELEEELCVA